MRSLFIYWKLPPALLPQAVSAAREWQATLRARHPGLRTGLFQRSDAAGRAEDLLTVMETYALAGGIDDATQLAIDAAGQAGLLDLGAPRRHVELFDRLDD